jgi:hypothetical protein
LENRLGSQKRNSGGIRFQDKNLNSDTQVHKGVNLFAFPHWDSFLSENNLNFYGEIEDNKISVYMDSK